jgi:large subunit ribosomal protein L21
MYAIFRSGGRQYRAEIGAELHLERLPNKVGEKVSFKEVLLLSDGSKAEIGKPLVKGATVKATIVEQFKGKKIIVWKYRPRKRYRRKYGHRQYYTRLRIDDIVPPKAKEEAEPAPKKEEAKPTPKKEAAKPAPKKAEPPAKKEVAPKKESAPSQPSTRKTLATLGVSDRVASALVEGGIKTVSAFLKALEEGGDKALLDIKGFGQKGLEEVKQILTDAGYKLPK